MVGETFGIHFFQIFSCFWGATFFAIASSRKIKMPFYSVLRACHFEFDFLCIYVQNTLKWHVLFCQEATAKKSDTSKTDKNLSKMCFKSFNHPTNFHRRNVFKTPRKGPYFKFSSQECFQNPPKRTIFWLLISRKKSLKMLGLPSIFNEFFRAFNLIKHRPN